jgi:hypothetical protein
VFGGRLIMSDGDTALTRGTAVTAGLVVGLLVAAGATAAVVPMLPPSMRGISAMSVTMIVVVGAIVGLFWAISKPGGE